MGLPEKEYFTLEDIAKRWEIDLNHVQCYASHGLLEIQTCLNDVIVTVYSCHVAPNVEDFVIKKSMEKHTGYVIIPPKDLQRLFQCGSSPVSRFIAIGRQEIYEIPSECDDKETYEVHSDNLVVSFEEIERFERTHHLNCGISDQEFHESVDEKTFQKTSSSKGRPSVMSKIIGQFQIRCKEKTISSSLANEANWLHGWAKENLKETRIPKPQSIKNAIRIDYRRISKKS